MQNMRVEENKRSSKLEIVAVFVIFTLLIVLIAASIYFFMHNSQLERHIAQLDTHNSQLEKHISQLEFRLKKLESFIEIRIRESVSDVEFSETELEKFNRKRRDTTDQLSNLPLHELLSLRGRDGKDGKDGKDGQNGLNGRDGEDGQNGLNGRDGEDGQNGIDGQDCDCSSILSTSTAVPTISSSLAEKLANITNSVRELQSRVLPWNHLGSSYIRWGRTSCGNNSQLLYQGFAAGSHFDQEGGSAEYTCLPQNPEYNRWSTSDMNGWIYGAEYQSRSAGIFPNEAYNKNVPCARCYTPNRSETIMIPAKTTCPNAWNKEYEGYLMSGYRYHKHTYSYACVDANPEYIFGSSADTNGALFYFVQTSCSSTHHCPPYKEGWELTCVVCSK